jgi:(p)ppGpp synthase/HD superfamily hydrolase
LINENAGRRVHVTADRDPGVLLRVLERFSNLNLIPQQFNATCDANDQILIEIDVGPMSSDVLALIVAKIRQLPAVLDAEDR